MVEHYLEASLGNDDGVSARPASPRKIAYGERFEALCGLHFGMIRQAFVAGEQSMPRVCNLPAEHSGNHDDHRLTR